MKITTICDSRIFVLFTFCRDRDRRERGPGEEGEEGIKIKQEPEDGEY